MKHFFLFRYIPSDYINDFTLFSPDEEKIQSVLDAINSIHKTIREEGLYITEFHQFTDLEPSLQPLVDYYCQGEEPDIQDLLDDIFHAQWSIITAESI